MELKYIFDFYKEFSDKNNISKGRHRTHISTIISKLISLLHRTSPSCNEDTDRYVNIIYGSSCLYSKLEKAYDDYNDKSEVLFIKGKPPRLFIKKLADIILHIIIYACTNGWGDILLQEIDDSIIKDKSNSHNKTYLSDERLYHGKF